MPNRAVTLRVAAGCAVVGMILLLLASLHVFRGKVLSTTESALLFVGLGLVIVAGVLAIIDVRAEAEHVPNEPSDVPVVEDGAVESVTTASSAPSWTFRCRAEGAGRVDAGDLSSSVRRGATLAAYQEGVTIAIGKTEEKRAWDELTAITATLNPSEAQISVSYDGRHGDTSATFVGRNADLAPVATALVAAAPAGLVTVSYGTDRRA
jgi:hypothetical protein